MTKITDLKKCSKQITLKLACIAYLFSCRTHSETFWVILLHALNQFIGFSW